MISLHVTQKELENTQGSGGVEIHIEGIVGNPEDGSSIPIFIEKYEGKVRVIVWNGNDEPIIHNLVPASPPQEPSKPTTSHRCPECKTDLTTWKSVSRGYTNKDGGPSAYALGHYDENGDFEPDNGPLPEGRYDLGDNSDTCAECEGEL